MNTRNERLNYWAGIALSALIRKNSENVFRGANSMTDSDLVTQAWILAYQMERKKMDIHSRLQNDPESVFNLQ